jgi:Indigoidine synthase A like protein
MMLGPASWQAPIRLACHPNPGRHILVFSRSISREPIDRGKRRALFKKWMKLNSFTANYGGEESGPVFSPSIREPTERHKRRASIRRRMKLNSFTANSGGEESGPVLSRSISRGPADQFFKGWTRVEKWKAESSPANSYVKESRPVFKVSSEVARALRDNAPVVALETTIYTHGFPYPDNVELALDLERIVRANGAIPATIGVVGGVARVGLTKEEIVTLASGAGKPETMKVSRRDLPYILGMVCKTYSLFA